MALSSKVQKRLFLFGSFIVFLLATLLFYRINALVDSFSQIDHTNQVELNLAQVMSHLKGAESAQRGFLLIRRDSSFLREYALARVGVDSAIAEVTRLTKKNLRQQQHCASLRNLIDQRYSLFNTSLLQSSAAADTFGLNISRGQASMNRIQELMNRMKAVEQNLLQQRESDKELYMRLTPVSLLFLVFAVLSIIGFSYYGLTKQLKETRKYATDLDYANNELLRKNKQLENSVEELNAFNYIASHDLKEPLRKILFFADAILNEANYKNLPDGIKQYLEKIQTSSGRMKTLLDDLLIYAQSGMSEGKKERVDLNGVLATIAESPSEQMNKKKASISYKNLPVITGVPSQMLQLFENLISNAVKYSREGVAPAITIMSAVVSRPYLPAGFEAAHERYYEIRFSDNGIGFTQNNAEKIFVLFQRLHNRHEFSGTGIGLTICRKIVQNHDGFIKAESEVNKGTTFMIYLPAY